MLSVYTRAPEPAATTPLIHLHILLSVSDALHAASFLNKHADGVYGKKKNKINNNNLKNDWAALQLVPVTLGEVYPVSCNITSQGMELD